MEPHAFRKILQQSISSLAERRNINFDSTLKRLPDLTFEYTQSLFAQQQAGLPRAKLFSHFRDIFEDLVITRVVDKEKGDLGILCPLLYYEHARK